MGVANAMKQNNADGKLTEEEKEQLRDHVIELTVEAGKELLGKGLKINKKDLEAKVAAAVKLFKMQYFQSGMAEENFAEELMRDFFDRNIGDADPEAE